MMGILSNVHFIFPGVSFVHVCHYAWITLRTLSILVQIVMLLLGFTNHKPIIVLIPKLTKRSNCKRLKYFIPHYIIIYYILLHLLLLLHL